MNSVPNKDKLARINMHHQLSSNTIIIIIVTVNITTVVNEVILMLKHLFGVLIPIQDHKAECHPSYVVKV